MKPIRKVILTTCIALSLAQSSKAELNTINLMTEAALAIPDCLDYEVNSVALKTRMTLLGPEFFWTLNISHNSPDFLTMAHSELDKSPFTEFNIFLGPVYKKLTNIAINVISPVNMTIGGGRYEHGDWGQHQSVQFSESTVMGHPGAIILQLLSRGELGEPYETIEKEGGVASEDVHEELAAEFLEGFAKGEYDDEKLYKIFDLKKLVKMVKELPGVAAFIDTVMSRISQYAESVGGKINGVFCTTNIAPYSPYYLSGIDALSWRMGYPITDPEFTKTIINPLSKDKIGTKVLDPLLKVKIDEKWGHIYPREGTVDIQHTAKLAAVTAYRSNSVLADVERSGIRIYRKPPYNNIGAWNKVYPEGDKTTPGASPSSCHKNIANTGIKLQEESMYAYTSWPRYTCDLAGGLTIFEIPVGINITPSVPE